MIIPSQVAPGSSIQATIETFVASRCHPDPLLIQEPAGTASVEETASHLSARDVGVAAEAAE